tara:strand:- start:3878 stop:4729 length:852 start_codon:yes stop_codon:yes gene_type:complete
MTISKDVLYQAAQLVDAGVIPAEASRMLGISVPSVIKGCKEYNVDHTKAKLGRKKKFEPALVEKLKVLKRKGMYAKEIAEQINTTTDWTITESQVRSLTTDVKRGKRSTVKPGKFVKERQPKPPSERDLNVFRMWCEYKTLREVGEAFDVSHERIRQILAKLRLYHGMERPPKPRTIVVCEYCGVEYEQETRPGSNYCGTPCAHRSTGLKNQKVDSKWSRVGGITLTCAYCKKTFWKSNYENTQMKLKYEREGRSAPKNRFCSRACNIHFRHQKPGEEEQGND